MDFADIIIKRLRELRLNVNQAEAAHGFPQGYIRGVVREDDKRATPAIDKAERIATALGLDFYVGPRRDPQGFAETSGDWDSQLFEIGSGVQRIALNKSLLVQRGLRPQDLETHIQLGNRMEPTITEGALVLYDKTKTDPPPSSTLDDPGARTIFVCVYRETEMMCRASRPDGTRLLFSFDNNWYGPMIVDVSSVRVLGAVVWTCQNFQPGEA